MLYLIYYYISEKFYALQESLGHVDINLVDVVYNNRINEKYHLINSRNGMIHIDIKWNAT